MESKTLRMRVREKFSFGKDIYMKLYMVDSGKQEFRRTDFGSRLLAAEGEGGGGSEGESAEDRCG